MKTYISPNHISLVKQAALRHGIELTENNAFNHAAKILDRITDADETDTYGQDFWTAAKEYFLN